MAASEVLRRQINRKHGLKLSTYSPIIVVLLYLQSFVTEDYHDLHKYSVEDYTFWLDLWEFLGIVSSVPPNKVFQAAKKLSVWILRIYLGKDCILEKGKMLQEIPNWFPGSRLNYAENLLIRKDDGVALIEANESGAAVQVTFRELNERVREMAAALRVNGLKVGDRVAGRSTQYATFFAS